MNQARPHIGGAPSRTPWEVARYLDSRPWLGSVVVAVSFFAVALGTAMHLDVPFRDPEGTFGPRFVLPVSLIVAALALDLAVRAVRVRRAHDAGSRLSVREIFFERWSRHRIGLALIGFLTFHLTYLGYRNLKSFLPWFRPESWDKALMEIDRALFLGYVPAEVLHAILGTGVAAQALAGLYLLFLLFVPVSLASALVLSEHVRNGYWYATALNINWVLGTASYYAVPSLGPIFLDPGMFADLPHTGVSRLQGWLIDSRLDVIRDPLLAEGVQSIAAFASLHVSIVFTAYLIVRRLRMRKLTWMFGVFLAGTLLSTVYFGWHYVVDDIAGLAIGWVAVVLGSWLTGAGRHPQLDHTRAAV